jgi:hypothetical protein
MSKEGTVKIFHRINKLKIKAGAKPGDTRRGLIDTNAVSKAQKAIDDGGAIYKQEVKAVLNDIDIAWEDIKSKDDPKAFQKGIDNLYNHAHNAKDIAETYHYDLMAFFSRSLRDFCSKIDVNNKAHHIIVKAHMDVMAVTYKNNLKDQSSAAAEELKSVLEKAIKKYS